MHTILVADDERGNLEVILNHLGNRYKILHAVNGQIACRVALKKMPDLIIMDIQLPKVSGVDLIEEAKRDLELAPIPVLAVTAYAGKGDEERIRAAGAAGYLAKPVSIMPFMNAIKELLPA